MYVLLKQNFQKHAKLVFRNRAPPPAKAKTFFSSSESEGEDEPGKKFKIKIKPLAPDNGTVSTVDELKASVGTLAISTSPLVRANKSSSSSQILLRTITGQVAHVLNKLCMPQLA